MLGFLSKLGVGGFVALFQYLVPIISQLVHAAEAANPEPGNGAAKFDEVSSKALILAQEVPMVIQAVEASGKAITDAAHSGDVAVLTKGIGDIINLTVAGANAAGVFQKAGIVQDAPSLQSAADKALADANAAGGVGG